MGSPPAATGKTGLGALQSLLNGLELAGGNWRNAAAAA
jgi:hypothetical protein